MALPQSILITGANRGLGLEMVKQFLAKVSPQFLFATYRSAKTSEELFKLANQYPNLHLIPLDVQNHKEFDSVAEKVYEVTKGGGLNLLINNSGVYSDDGQNFSDVTKETLMHYFEINTVGSLLLVRALFNQLEKGAQKSTAEIGAGKALVVNISSDFASTTNNTDGGYYASRCTRAALNALTKNMSVEFIPKGIMAISISPGWVQTDQGGPSAPLKPKESVAGTIKLIQSLIVLDNGKFFRYDGTELPW